MVVSLERFPKSTRLHLLYSYIQQEKMKNKFKALFEITLVRQNKPSLQEDFGAYRFQ
jgi:hypothetical protein